MSGAINSHIPAARRFEIQMQFRKKAQVEHVQRMRLAAHNTGFEKSVDMHTKTLEDLGETPWPLEPLDDD